MLGASSGIGRAIAIECAAAGASVILNARNIEKLQAVYDLLSIDAGQQHELLPMDLTNKELQTASLIGLTPFDGVVSCIGMLKKQPFKFLQAADLEMTLSTNFTSPVLYLQKLYKKNLLLQGGSVVFISSIAAEIASLGNLSYMASKGALNSMARGMALELAPKRIRVNYIEPALIQTDLSAVLTDEDQANYLKRFPLGRFGEPEEVAYAAIYLLSDATKWVTGTSIRIDGGVTLK